MPLTRKEFEHVLECIEEYNTFSQECKNIFKEMAKRKIFKQILEMLIKIELQFKDDELYKQNKETIKTFFQEISTSLDK